VKIKTFDSKCHDLAEHFSQDEHLSKEELHDLACQIQETVESFFSTRENAAEAAYDRSMEEPTFRGGEYAASVAAEQARIQRELK
jgi:arsenate reductase-like glutaredoxin family protein